MAPAGRGALRPYQPSRFQPFLIVCLLVTTVVVGYSFWNQMKKNSVLLAEIGRIQTTLRRIESERKDCKIQLGSMEEERRQHEAADKEKENTLEDTRQVVEDLKSEQDLFKKNISKLLSQIANSELKEDKSQSECDERCEAIRTEMRKTCIEEKEKIQQEMDDQVGVMKSRLLQCQERENSDEKLQKQKQDVGNDTAARRGDSTAQSEQQVPRGDDAEPVQQQQRQQRQLPVEQSFPKSRLNDDQLRRGQLSDNRAHGRQQEILAYRSKEAQASKSQNEPMKHRGNEEVVYSKQTGTGRHLRVNFSSTADEISGIDRRRQLNRANENGEDSQKGERETVGTEQPAAVNGKSAPDAEDTDPGRNSELSERKRLKLSQESDKSDTLSQRSDGQDQQQSLKNPGTEDKESHNNELDQAAANQKLLSQGSLQSQKDEGNSVESDNHNTPERTRGQQQNNGNPSHD